MLSLVRSDAIGEMEMRGDRAQFHGLAARLREGADSSVLLDPVPDPSPYDRSLSRVVVRGGSGKVTVALTDDGQSLLIHGGSESMNVLAANIEGLAQEGSPGEDAHIEYFPEHYYLSEEAEPLILTLI